LFKKEACRNLKNESRSKKSPKKSPTYSLLPPPKSVGVPGEEAWKRKKRCSLGKDFPSLLQNGTDL
jgi:hypothetical protein